MTRLQYFLREAVASLKRGGASNAIAVGTIALALFVLGAFLLVTASLDRLMAGWSSAAELSVYLKDDATEENRAAIETALADSRLVERREFVGQAEALQRFRHDFPDLAAAADGVGASAFPASIEARLRAGAMAGDAVTRLARSVARMTGVADVRFDRQWLDRLARLIAVVRGIGLALASALALAAAFTIA
ncbi:MAG: cell division protein FtsX, partial [Bacteroidales bacterium]